MNLIQKKSNLQFIILNNLMQIVKAIQKKKVMNQIKSAKNQKNIKKKLS
jgi:hypothetical protein